MPKFNLLSYIMPPEDKLFFIHFQDSATVISTKVLSPKQTVFFSAVLNFAGALMEIPLGTTHVISTSIMSIDTTFHAHAVKWRVVDNIVIAWVLTIPACAIISAIAYYLTQKIF